MSESPTLSTDTLFDDRDKQLITSLLAKITAAREQNDRISVIDRDELTQLLDEGEVSQVEKVYSIDPSQYGFNGPKQGVESVPNNLVRIAPQPYSFEGQEIFTATQYLPEHTHLAYSAMAQAIESEIGRKLLIESSYRSNDFQAITFLKILKIYDFDLQRTIKRAAVPGYSEHTTPSRLALDLQNTDGLPTDETPQYFETTQEYDWLVKNAHTFDFHMSYPKNNKYGRIYEPWHWRHIPR